MNDLLLTQDTPIIEDWIDYNGHLRDAYYLLIFSHATDTLMDRIGLDVIGRQQHQHTLYTLEAHLNYLAETRLGERVQVYTQLVDHDEKRLHIVHHLYRPKDGVLLAVSEQMLMNINVSLGRGARFAAEVEEHISTLYAQHRLLVRPGYCGRVIGIRR